MRSSRLSRAKASSHPVWRADVVGAPAKSGIETRQEVVKVCCRYAGKLDEGGGPAISNECDEERGPGEEFDRDGDKEEVYFATPVVKGVGVYEGHEKGYRVG